MMDLRYHLASLMSVFLALAVGILVGASLGSSERQAATIQRLQQDVAAIRSEDTQVKTVSAELQQQLTAREAAEQQDLLPLVVHGRLAGSRVALLLTGGDAAEDLRLPVTHALRLAGADVLIFRLPRGEPAAPPGPGSAGPAEPHGQRDGSSSTASAHDTTIASGTAAGMLARALLAGRPALLEAARARMPDLEVIGELRAPIHRLLLLCPNDRPDYARRVAAGSGIETAMARAVQEAGALLVAVEPEEAPDPAHSAGSSAADKARSIEAVSLLPTLAGLGASTVDNVDTAAGQIALILALAGAHGNFGTGPGATGLFPPSLIPHP